MNTMNFVSTATQRLFAGLAIAALVVGLVPLQVMAQEVEEEIFIESLNTTLTLEKRVSGEGSAVGNEWLLKAEGPQGFEGAGRATRTWTELEFDAITVPTWDLIELPIDSENPITNQYIAGNWECRVTGELNGSLIPLTNSNQITLEKGDDVTCRITNTYREPITSNVTVEGCKINDTGAPVVGWNISATNGVDTETVTTGTDGCYSIVIPVLPEAQSEGIIVSEEERTGWEQVSATVGEFGQVTAIQGSSNGYDGCFFGITAPTLVPDLSLDLGDSGVLDRVAVVSRPTPTLSCDFVNRELPAEICSVTIVSDTVNNTVLERDNALPYLATYPWTAVIPGASWIWADAQVQNPTQDETYTFEQSFVWNGPVTEVLLMIAADNSFEARLNGEVIGVSPAENNHAVGTQKEYSSFTGEVKQGENVLSVSVRNWALRNGTPSNNPAGLLYSLTVGGSDQNCNRVPERFTLEIDITGEGDGQVMSVNEEGEPTGDIMCFREVEFTEEELMEMEGGVLAAKCSAVFEEGTEVNLVALPFEGSNFDNSWTVGGGTCTGNTTPCTLTMNQNYSLLANFDLNGGTGGDNVTSTDTSSTATRIGTRVGSRTPVPQVAGATDSAPATTPEPLVLGEQVSIVPVGAPNTGKGGASPSMVLISAWLAVPRRCNE